MAGASQSIKAKMARNNNGEYRMAAASSASAA